jgi:hypothetical protein
VVEQPENGVSQTALATALTEQPVTATTDNDVAVAAIQADAQVQIAAIEADASVAREESYAEVQKARIDNEEDISWRMSRLEERQTEILAKLEVLTTPAITEPLPISLEEATTEVVEAASETLEATNLIPQSTSTETSETQTEASEKSEEESLLPPLLEVGRKPIIKLV